jgi:hypothetical protein
LKDGSEILAKRLIIIVSLIERESIRGNIFWTMCVDDYSVSYWIYFITILKLVEELQSQKIFIKPF